MKQTLQITNLFDELVMSKRGLNNLSFLLDQNNAFMTEASPKDLIILFHVLTNNLDSEEQENLVCNFISNQIVTKKLSRYFMNSTGDLMGIDNYFENIFSKIYSQRILNTLIDNLDLDETSVGERVYSLIISIPEQHRKNENLINKLWKFREEKGKSLPGKRVNINNTYWIEKALIACGVDKNHNNHKINPIWQHTYEY